MSQLIAKILFCGDAAVGKTTIRDQYLGLQVSSKYSITIGADLSIKTIDLVIGFQKYKLKLFLLDLAGQSTFDNVRSSYYKGAHAAFLVYDITNKSSFYNIKNWVKEIRTHGDTFPIPMVLVANKIDLKGNMAPGQAIVTTFEGQKFAKVLSRLFYNDTWDIPYIETSAMTGENIEVAFQLIGRFLLKDMLGI